MAEPVSATNLRGGSAGLIVGLLILAASFGLATARLRPPAPKPADAPEGEFSAGRARAVLTELVGNGEPHPLGSAANAQVRERVLLAFRRLGYEPEVVPGFVCRSGGPCATVQNVVARLAGNSKPGEAIPKAVMLSAHYDSVPSGPGVSDDLTGVAAILEIARQMKALPPPDNPVVFLIDDGEEPGLLGAEAFVRTPLAREIGAVINLEARGTSGPGLMFQTHHWNGSWIPLFARAVSRPVASSVFITLYERLPNDTDYTVFQRAGIPGFNFALIGDAERYHLPLDNLANASTASLQHMGESASELARALAKAPLVMPKRAPAVFFDVLSLGLVRWPAAATLPLAILALGLVLWSCRRVWIRRADGVGGTLLAALVALISIAAAVGLSLVFVNAQKVAGGLAVAWPAQPGTLLVALGALSAFGVLGVSSTVGRGGRSARVWTGIWLVWGVLGLVTGLMLPGSSYLFIVPALVAGLVGSVVDPSRSAVASLLPLAVAGVLWAPLVLLVFAGLGAPGIPALAAVIGLFAMPLVPLLVGTRRPGLWAGAFGLVAVVAAFLVPATTRASAEAPKRLAIYYHLDADAGTGRYVLLGDLRRGQPLPPSLAAAAPFTLGQTFPWTSPQSQGFVAPAPAVELVPPAFEVLADETRPDGRHLSLRLSSPRGAPVLRLQVPASAEVRTARMEDEEIPKQPDGKLARQGDWLAFQCLSMPPEGIVLELVLGATAPFDAYIADRSLGLIPAARTVAAARTPEWIADGDSIVVSRKVHI